MLESRKCKLHEYKQSPTHGEASEMAVPLKRLLTIARCNNGRCSPSTTPPINDEVRCHGDKELCLV